MRHSYGLGAVAITDYKRTVGFTSEHHNITTNIGPCRGYPSRIEPERPGHSRYTGEYTPIISDYIGLEQGIKETYKKLQ